MARLSATSPLIERGLEETIAQLVRVPPSPEVRAMLIEARRLRSVVAGWGAVLPPPGARTELYASALQLFARAGVPSPDIDLSAAARSSYPAPTGAPHSYVPSFGATFEDKIAQEARRSPSQVPTQPPPRGSRRASIAPGITLYRPDAMQWRAFPGVEGVSVKVLNRNPDTSVFRAVVRMEAGSLLPAHRHVGDEEIVVVDGSASLGDDEMLAGEYCHAEPGSVHGIISTVTGCTLFVVGSERDELVL